MPVRPLAPNASLDHLRHQAKDLRKTLAAKDPATAQLVREFHPRHHKSPDEAIFTASFKLSDAQLVIARSHGFPSWASLKQRIERPLPAADYKLSYYDRIADKDFVQALRFIDAGDAAFLRAHLESHPTLVRQRVVFEGRNYFRNPTLLEFVAENPVRNGTLPSNIAEIAKIILDAGAKRDVAALNETLGLVCSGRVPRETGQQLRLIDLLCTTGADASKALPAALGQGEFQAAEQLIRCGARVDLPAAAAMGRTEDARRLLPAATREDRHRALALASQFGHAEIVRLLLDAGEDPNRYNSPGTHSHSTPLHQAALAGHLEVVKLLVERGARLDLKDVLWQGTPLGWAIHGERSEVETYLRSLMPP
jgi:hypothetical protein